MDKSGDKVLHLWINHPMLIGEYSHSIDAKKRLAVPSKLRKELGKRAILTRGLDSCLFLYPLHEWQKFIEKISSMPVGQSDMRTFVRLMLSSAVEVELDQLGRILIPDYLKQYAGLEQKITITGVYNRLEIWDTDRWNNYKTTVEKNTDMIAEKLGEMGLY